MRYLGILFVLICSYAAYGQNSFKLQKEGTKRSHDLFLGDRLNVKKNNGQKINGYLSGWTDTTIIFDFDTILFSEILSVYYTPKLRKKISKGIEIAGTTTAGIGVGVIGYSIFTFEDTEGSYGYVGLFFGALMGSAMLKLAVVSLYGISGLFLMKRRYKINQEEWQFVAS